MPADLTADRLAELAVETLEEAAFVFAEATDPPPPFAGDVLEARLHYSGPERGVLGLRASSGFAAGLAANMLGADCADPESDRRSADALGEMVNMLAGAVLLELFGPDSKASIGVPSVKPVSQDSAPAGCLAHLATEEGDRLDVFLRPANGGPP